MSRYSPLLTLFLIEAMFLAGFVSAGFVVKAWIGPSASPPGGSVAILPSTAIAFFNDTICPSGWSEATSARGRYLVGLPSSGTLAGTIGTALTNLENRNFGTHTHSATAVNSGHTHALQAGGGTIKGTGSGYFTSGGDTVTVTVNALNLPAGTPAPYIQFLACEKL